MSGILYLIPTPIGNLSEVSPRIISTIKEVDFVACEDTRNTSKLLSLLGLSKTCISCHEHNEFGESEKIVNQILNGKNVAYMSDAGYPCISDPGSILVKKAIENRIKVVPLSGPNAFLNGLVGSGIDSSHFLFYGFLDPKESKRKSELEKLKNIEFTLIFYEAPHRIMDTLKSIYEVLGNRQICVARELTKVYEEFIRGDVKSIIENYESFKGEMVIIVEKNQENTKNNGVLDGFLEKVNALTSAGLSQKDAINAVSTLFNVNKNKLYKEVINNKKD